MVEKKFFNTAHGLMDDHNRGINRSDLYFCRTHEVPIPEYRALLYGFWRIIYETGRGTTTHDYRNFYLGRIPYGSPDWYQEQAVTKRDRGFGIQISARKVDSLLRNEPFQKENPHFDVMIIGMDLTTGMNDPQNNFIFGYGPYPNNIVSVKRFMHWIKDPHLREAALAILGAHEFGHNLDLVSRNFNVGTEGYKAGHCNGDSGPCLMEQVNVPGARNIEAQARLIYSKSKWLCPDCSEEIEFKKDDLKRMGIHW